MEESRRVSLPYQFTHFSIPVLTGGTVLIAAPHWRRIDYPEGYGGKIGQKDQNPSGLRTKS